MATMIIEKLFDTMELKHCIGSYKRYWSRWYRTRHPKRKEYYKAYYQKHRDKKQAYARSYGRANPEKMRLLKRKWIAEHPDEWRAYCREKMMERYWRKRLYALLAIGMLGV